MACVDCGNEKIYCKQRCRLCYRRDLYKRSSGECAACGHDKIWARGLCFNCYDRCRYHGAYDAYPKVRYSRDGDCIVCGYSKRYARGMCHRCYRQSKAEECVCCGRVMAINALGMCSACYARETGVGVVAQRKREATRKGLEATFTSDDWDVLVSMTDGRCLYCGEKRSDLHQEHWVPLSRGGGYTYENIVPSCPQCNMEKHAMTGEEFLQKNGVTLVCDIDEIKNIAMEVYSV